MPRRRIVDANTFANPELAPGQRARVQDAQVSWLQRVLGTGARRWTVVVQHQPIYSVTRSRDFAAMREALGTLYDEYRVDLVLQGHDHAYARTPKVHGGRQAGASAHGTVYATSVSGPEVNRVTTPWQPLMAALRERALLFQVISVSEGRLSYESRTTGGALVDAFSLTRPLGAGPSAATVLSEGLPLAAPAPK